MIFVKILSSGSPFDWIEPQDPLPVETVAIDIPPLTFPPGQELRLAVFLFRDAYARLTSSDASLEYEGTGVTRMFDIAFNGREMQQISVHHMDSFRDDFLSHAHIQMDGLDMWFFWPGEKTAQAYAVFRTFMGDHWLIARKIETGSGSVLQITPLVRKPAATAQVATSTQRRPAL